MGYSAGRQGCGLSQQSRSCQAGEVIEELLADPQYGRHLADVWDHLLVPRNTPGCEPAIVPLTQYLEKKFNANVPWDEVVRDLLTATGSQKENGGRRTSWPTTRLPPWWTR